VTRVAWLVRVKPSINRKASGIAGGGESIKAYQHRVAAAAIEASRRRRASAHHGISSGGSNIEIISGNSGDSITSTSEKRRSKLK